MSGTGKSSLIAELAALGYNAVDTDAGWCEPQPDGRQRWREDAIQALLATEDTDVLFVAGCEENQVKFHSQFDHIILLSAPVDVLKQRLATRTNNPFGKSAGEFRRFLADLHEVEPLLRAIADCEIDTTMPLSEVVTAILRAVGAQPPIARGLHRTAAPNGTFCADRRHLLLGDCRAGRHRCRPDRDPRHPGPSGVRARPARPGARRHGTDRPAAARRPAVADLARAQAPHPGHGQLLHPARGAGLPGSVPAGVPGGASGAAGGVGGPSSGGSGVAVLGGLAAALLLLLLLLARRAQLQPVWRSYLPEVPPA